MANEVPCSVFNPVVINLHTAVGHYFLVRCSCFFRGGGLLVEVVLDISKSLPVMREVSPMGISQRNRLATMQRLAGGSAELGRQLGDSIIIESHQGAVEGGVP